MFCDFVGVFTNKTGIAQVKLLVKRPINGGNVGRPTKAKIRANGRVTYQGVGLLVQDSITAGRWEDQQRLEAY